MEALPLGIGLSGRSFLSSSASKTSLNTIPPPYNPIVVKVSHSKEFSKEGVYPISDEKTCKAAPETAKPAKISAIAVTIFAGRISCK